ncbi:M56 family metallopeptidase [Flavobacterium suzhouense]|uniref:M56 family metallopeptidase n=1 Tax=Flavobacterium suzhouense TaxID=1529638 RepID=A0ABW5NUK0_9FLAO
MTDFLIKSTVAMGVLLGLYYVLFEREKMHRFNRFYLLGALILSLVLPFISFSVYNENLASTITLLPLELGKNQNQVLQTGNNSTTTILCCLYATGTLLMLFRFVKNIKAIRSSVNSNKRLSLKNASLVLVDAKILPHTFMKYIFVNKDEYENRELEKEFFTHELAHVNQLHTLDVIFVELIRAFYWFNPLIYFYKKAIQLNHEFLADENVLKNHKHVITYQNLLLSKASGKQHIALASNLNFSLTKKRFVMMTKTTNRFLATFKQAVAIPVIAGLLLVSCVDTPEEKTESPHLPKSKSKTVVQSNEDTYNVAALNTQPEYPGGMQAFYSQVMKNFQVPEIDHDLTAKIYVSFVVEKDGAITDIKILRDPGYGLGDEAKRVLELDDTKWKPGILNGKPVRASFNLPITINVKS